MVKITKISAQASDRLLKPAKQILNQAADFSKNKFQNELSNQPGFNPNPFSDRFSGGRISGFGMSGFKSSIIDFDFLDTLPKASQKLRGKTDLAEDTFELTQK